MSRVDEIYSIIGAKLINVPRSYIITQQSAYHRHRTLFKDKVISSLRFWLSWLQLPGPIFYLLLGVSSDYAQPITGQVTEVTCPVIGRAQPELTLSKRQKTGPDVLTHLRIYNLEIQNGELKFSPAAGVCRNAADAYQWTCIWQYLAVLSTSK